MADDKAIKSLIDGLATTQNDTSLADFVIVCEEQRYSVQHRLILALHSPVLAKTVKGEFKEATKRKVDLSDDGPLCVKALVHYFYALSYTLPDLDRHDEALILNHHVKMCIMADKYDIQPLKNLAISVFKGAAKDIARAQELSGAAALAYEAAGATEEIRKTIVDIGIERNLLSFKHDTSLGRVMADFPEFARDYAQTVEGQLAELKKAPSLVGGGARVRETEKRYKCPICNLTFVVYFQRAYVYYCPACASASGRQAQAWLSYVVDE
ncbi:hypothetical protein LTR36_003227 [Oleoguttula mirabilis]|uniref:BTB domain-containing protein n=1 Tax=Oleoguttula mirabilis TaxID=1507867 RepID=A0AAV9JXG7_9PEZI|nr:hypothetical protein LTR36_003227 [Oleoguttula mirabilis]